GFDAPPLHTLYLDRPLKGALLMQTLARVNRTFRGKRDGLLVAYAPLADNLRDALAEYTATDQAKKPVGQTTDEVATTGVDLVKALRALLRGFDWRRVMASTDPKRARKAVGGAVEYLRSPHTPGNQVAEGALTVGDRYRMLSAQLGRVWAMASGADALAALRDEVRFYEEVRVWMAKYDAKEREANGQPIPEEILRALRGVVADATAVGDITDIYAAAGIPRPSIQALTPEMLAGFQRAEHPHLAIEALRDLLVAESRQATTGNVVRQKAFSERIAELMNRYTNQQLTSAEVIAELARLAQEVADEADRGQRFTPPLGAHELAFYDAVSQNDSAVLLQGDDMLAQIARELVGVMQRDVRTDWTRRPDVQAKLRSEVKRLLRRYKYPPDRQPGAVTLVLEQMEVLANAISPEV
ncbi:MAG: type I restriction enzyme endonuclease domain-containing protein, partial [Propioniciclava sp.]